MHIIKYFSDDFLINNIIKDSKDHGNYRGLLQQLVKLLLWRVLRNGSEPLRSYYAFAPWHCRIYSEQSHRRLFMGGPCMVAVTHRLCSTFVILSGTLRSCVNLAKTNYHVCFHIFMGSQTNIQFLQKGWIYFERVGLSLGIHS